MNRLKKLAYRLKTWDWHAFLKTIVKLRCSNKVKEYFKRLEFYTLIGKNTEPHRNLEVTINKEKKIITEKEYIDKITTIKYKRLRDDKGYKVRYINPQDEVIRVNYREVKYAIRRSVKDKAVAWDLIPGKAINKLCKKKAKYKKEIVQKITELINEYLESKCIPIEMCTSRLFFLNKEASEIGKLDKIRPIAISSSFIKIIEKCLLSEIVNHINYKELIHKSQIGFADETGCELNLMRIRQKSMEVRKVLPRKNKYILFIDLKVI